MDKARGISALEKLDGFAPLRNGLRRVAKDRGDWAGIPMPLQDRPMKIEPGYPKAAELMQIGRPKIEPKDEEEESRLKLRNRFFSSKKGRDVVIFEDGDKIDWGTEYTNHVTMMIHTLDCSDAWGIEQEGNAVQTLGTLLRHRPFKQYLTTGMFIEASRRSGLFYLFRRLRPTIAITKDRQRILAALCMHPIGYYEGTWAGAMCPTDDVIAHLMLMRADEHMFWRRCNQHAPWQKAAGIN